MAVPVVTPSHMAAIDASAVDRLDVLIDRAGWAVARHALDLMGGAYGRRVVVVAGKGNNGADGRRAAHHLSARGVGVRVIEATETGADLGAPDLVIDAAYGTSLDREHRPVAAQPGCPVLAVDIPSGVDGLTGEVLGEAWCAVATTTFVAPKPGLLVGAGPALAGDVRVIDIGLDPEKPSSRRPVAWVAEADDVARVLPKRAPSDHKWRSACWLVGGKAPMGGALELAARGALGAGAGYVAATAPGCDSTGLPPEVVGRPHAVGEADGSWTWDDDLADRWSAVGVGPGLGRTAVMAGLVRLLADRVTRPLVIDADALLGPELAGLVANRPAPTVLTPHVSEFERLLGRPPSPDRIDEVSRFAGNWGVTLLLKGPNTIIASPGCETSVVTTGTAALATAGTGDVLTGILTAFLARGLNPHDAAVAAAHVHGLAGTSRHPLLPVASEVAREVPRVVATLQGQRPVVPSGRRAWQDRPLDVARTPAEPRS